jgi:hypothetical protein
MLRRSFTAAIAPRSGFVCAETGTEGTSQRLVYRNRSLDSAPICVLAVLVLILIWEIIRANLPTTWLHDWPWRIDVLGVASAAALTGALAALVAARRQFAQTIEPHLGWSGSDESGSSSLGRNTRWYTELVNSGGGLAVVRNIEYRITPNGSNRSERKWMDVDSARSFLKEDLELEEDTEFALTRISIGAGIGTGKDGVFQILALSDVGYRSVSAIDMHLDFDSAAGDRYTRTMYLIPPEHQQCPRR